jgi:GNAT superfamily N-acetyltransferase
MAYEVALPGGYVVSDDAARFDVDAIHRFLSEEAYWSLGRPRELVERVIAHALCLGLYAPDGSQAGFAKVVTDRTVAAHLGDVFVLPAHRGGGRGVALVRAALEHPELETVSRWTLNTLDAHGVYERFGFRRTVPTDNMMTWKRL